MVIATKSNGIVGLGVNDRGLSRRHIVRQVETSLRRLQTDWIDLYYAHDPDPDTPAGGDPFRLRRPDPPGQGPDVGLSDHPAWQVVQSLWSRRRLVSTWRTMCLRDSPRSLTPSPTMPLDLVAITISSRRPRRAPPRISGRIALDRRRNPRPIEDRHVAVGVSRIDEVDAKLQGRAETSSASFELGATPKVGYPGRRRTPYTAWAEN